mmetsp:Transcript_48497/g.79823  ORF Transcript_48497/g.79823 Transcript_48497/m.79823 type:complete len:315 (-) Transcript_48497:371-1315(-)
MCDSQNLAALAHHAGQVYPWCRSQQWCTRSSPSRCIGWAHATHLRCLTESQVRRWHRWKWLQGERCHCCHCQGLLKQIAITALNWPIQPIKPQVLATSSLGLISRPYITDGRLGGGRGIHLQHVHPFRGTRGHSWTHLSQRVLHGHHRHRRRSRRHRSRWRRPQTLDLRSAAPDLLHAVRPRLGGFGAWKVARATWISALHLHWSIARSCRPIFRFIRTTLAEEGVSWRRLGLDIVETQSGVQLRCRSIHSHDLHLGIFGPPQRHRCHRCHRCHWCRWCRWHRCWHRCWHLGDTLHILQGLPAGIALHILQDLL